MIDKHRVGLASSPPVKCNSLIRDVVCLISCCWVSLSLISSYFVLFSCNQTLARSRLCSGVALGPSWVSLALIPTLFPLFLVWLHHMWWCLVWLVWVGG